MRSRCGARGIEISPNAWHLELQLEAWRQGIRKNDPNDLMGHIARSLTDEEIKAVSEFFAGLGQ